MRRFLLFFFLLCQSIAWAQSNTPNPNMWVTNGTVNSIAVSGSTVYLGGSFTYVGAPNHAPMDAC